MSPPSHSQGDTIAPELGGPGSPSPAPTQPDPPVPPPPTPADRCWHWVLWYGYYWCPVMGLLTALLAGEFPEWDLMTLCVAVLAFFPYINWILYAAILMHKDHHRENAPIRDSALLCFYVLLLLLLAWLVALLFSRKKRGA